MDPNWTDKNANVISDEAAKMTGKCKGIVSYIKNATKPDFIKFWCSSHKLDCSIPTQQGPYRAGEMDSRV